LAHPRASPLACVCLLWSPRRPHTSRLCRFFLFLCAAWLCRFFLFLCAAWLWLFWFSVVPVPRLGTRLYSLLCLCACVPTYQRRASVFPTFVPVVPTTPLFLCQRGSCAYGYLCANQQLRSFGLPLPFACLIALCLCAYPVPTAVCCVPTNGAVCQPTCVPTYNWLCLLTNQPHCVPCCANTNSLSFANCSVLSLAQPLSS
jgi:hypothetical protein